MEFVGSELIFFHLLCSIPLFVPPLCNLYALIFWQSHTKKMRMLATIAPAFYAILSACFFSGIVIWAMLGFVFNFKILIMLFVWILSLIFEIKRHKEQKKAKVEADILLRQKFFRFAFFKAIFDLCAFCLLFILFL